MNVENTERQKTETLVGCRLCGELCEPQDSHVLPAFVFRWLKKTSATGFLRCGQWINKRVQDGLTRPWFCLACERKLNVSETKLANSIFDPAATHRGDRIEYGDWLLKFCVSVSYRSLLLMIDETELRYLSEVQRVAAHTALSAWQKFLLDKARCPDSHEQHLFPFYSVAAVNGEFPANFSRYITRTVDIDVPRAGDEAVLVFSKLGPIIVLGFVDVKYPGQWVGSKIDEEGGIIEPREYVMPKGFGDYLRSRANRQAVLKGEMSNAQRRKIEQACRKDMDRFMRSGTFRAMSEDVRAFGKKAFD